MRKYLLIFSVLQFGLAMILPSIAGADDAVPIQAGALKIYPTLDVKEAYNDNIYVEKNVTTKSLVTTISPSLSVVADSGANRIEVHYKISKGMYHSSSSDNFLDHDAGLKTAFGVTKRLKLKGALAYKKGNDIKGSTDTGILRAIKVPDTYNQTTLSGELSYGTRGKVDLKGKYTNKKYDNGPNVLDLNTAGGSFAFSFPVSKKTKAVFETRYKIFDYKSSAFDSNEQRYFVGLDWDGTAKTNGSVRLGYMNKSFRSPAINTFSQLSWELNATWKPLSVSSFTLSASSKPTESSGTGNMIKSQVASLSWEHQWTDVIRHNASIGYDQGTYEGIVRQDKKTTASFGVNYQMLRWLSFGGGYDFTNNSSSVVARGYRKNIWSINMKGTL